MIDPGLVMWFLTLYLMNLIFSVIKGGKMYTDEELLKYTGGDAFTALITHLIFTTITAIFLDYMWGRWMEILL